MIRVVVILAVGIVVVTSFLGCTPHPKLKITEVAPGAVEIYLDDPNTLDLSRVTLTSATGASFSNTLNLIGTMAARSYLVVYEEAGYTGQPVAATYTAPLTSVQCPGIKLSEDSFGWNLGNTNFAFRLSGSSGRGPSGIAGLFYRHWDSDDVVRIGTRPRPQIGGNFTEDTSTPVPLPFPPGTVSRNWGPNGPIDNDLESNWHAALPSWCSQTP